MKQYIIDSIKEMEDKGFIILSEYTSSNSKVDIKCPNNHIFNKTIKSFLRYKVCPECSGKVKMTIDRFKKFVKEVEGDNYTVISKDIINVHTKIKMKHNVCGTIYEVSPTNFKDGKRCPECNNKVRTERAISNAKSNIKTNSKFKEEMFELVGDEYKFLSKYTGKRDDIKCKHTKCGTKFITKPDYFKSYILKGFIPCPTCSANNTKNISIGEGKIVEILESLNIRFERQKKFEGCEYKRSLSFDFYLPDYNMCIEFDGSQHFKESKGWNEGSSLLEIQLRDQIKNEYCKDNGINLVRFNYKQLKDLDKLVPMLFE